MRASRSGTPRGAGDRTSNLPVTSQPALPPGQHTGPNSARDREEKIKFFYGLLIPYLKFDSYSSIRLLDYSEAGQPTDALSETTQKREF